MIGGFSSIPWKNSGGWTVDPKCVVFSLTRNKTYNRLNDTNNVHFGTSYSAVNGAFNISNKNLAGNNSDSYKIPNNGAGE